MKNVVCRFNGVDPQLVDELTSLAGRQANSVSQAHPASFDKKTLRVVTVLKFECDSELVAATLIAKFAPLAGVEVFSE